MEVLPVSPPADIRTIAIDADDSLYFAGGGALGSYVSRYTVQVGEEWTTLNPIDGNATAWYDIQVALESDTVVVAGVTDGGGDVTIGAASRLTIDGDELASSTTTEVTRLDQVALGPEGEVYVAGEVDLGESAIMRLAP